MKKWKKGLRRLTATALAVMMMGTTTDFSAFAVSAAEGGSESSVNMAPDAAVLYGEGQSVGGFTITTDGVSGQD